MTSIVTPSGVQEMITMSRTSENMQEDSEKGLVAFPDPIALVFEEALGKFHQGAAKYGAFDPATDRRDFIREAEAEILDAINYLAMFLVKLRATRETGADHSLAPMP